MTAATIIPFPGERFRPVDIGRPVAGEERPGNHAPRRPIYWHRLGYIYAERRLGYANIMRTDDIGRHLVMLADMAQMAIDMGEPSLFDAICEDIRELMTVRHEAKQFRLMFDIPAY